MKAKPSSIFSCFFKSLSCSWLAVAAHTLDKRALSLCFVPANIRTFFTKKPPALFFSWMRNISALFICMMGLLGCWRTLAESGKTAPALCLDEKKEDRSFARCSTKTKKKKI
jgi:hypothetical protein